MELVANTTPMQKPLPIQQTTSLSKQLTNKLPMEETLIIHVEHVSQVGTNKMLMGDLEKNLNNKILQKKSKMSIMCRQYSTLKKNVSPTYKSRFDKAFSKPTEATDCLKNSELEATYGNFNHKSLYCKTYSSNHIT